MPNPKIRFKKDDGMDYPDWKDVPFGSLIEPYSIKSKVEDEDILLSCAIDGMYRNSELFGHQRGKSNIGYLKVDKGTLILSAQNLHLGNANVNLRFDHGIISPAYKTFHITGCLVEFMATWVKREETKKFFYDATTVGASQCRRNVVWEDLYLQSFILPSIEEQRRIAALFSELDNLICFMSDEISNLEKFKKAMMQKIFSQEIRFKKDDRTEYAEWEKIKIKDCLDYEQPNRYIVHSQNYSDEYATPVLTANKQFILGYTNESDGHYNKGSVIIYDDFTMDMKYVCFPFKVKSSAIKMLTAKERYDLYFIYSLLVSLNLRQVTHTRSYISQVEPMVISVPSIEEQKKIADLFSAIDDAIIAVKKELEGYKNLKKYLLKQMFA